MELSPLVFQFHLPSPNKRDTRHLNWPCRRLLNSTMARYNGLTGIGSWKCIQQNNESYHRGCNLIFRLWTHFFRQMSELKKKINTHSQNHLSTCRWVTQNSIRYLSLLRNQWLVNRETFIVYPVLAQKYIKSDWLSRITPAEKANLH